MSFRVVFNFKDTLNYSVIEKQPLTFFSELQDLLEAEGHTTVEPYKFHFDSSGQTPLLIILRNEDIAEHICEVRQFQTCRLVRKIYI